MSNTGIDCTIRNVLCAPDINKNLLLGPKLTDNDSVVTFTKTKVIISRENYGKVIAEG